MKLREGSYARESLKKKKKEKNRPSEGEVGRAQAVKVVKTNKPVKFRLKGIGLIQGE